MTWWKCVIKEIYVLSGSYCSMCIGWEENLMMQEREGIIARTKSLSDDRRWDSKHRRKGSFYIGTQRIHQQLKKTRKLHRHWHEQAGRFWWEKQKLEPAPSTSCFPSENQKQGHQRVSLALSKGSQLPCCKVLYGEYTGQRTEEGLQSQPGRN